MDADKGAPKDNSKKFEEKDDNGGQKGARDARAGQGRTMTRSLCEERALEGQKKKINKGKKR